MKLIDRLFDGPLDVIGDIHGEIEALELLLCRLGYNKDGLHPDDRRMVFVGDLTDRGPDSPAVLRKVMTFCNEGRAQCVLGNHELALLNDDRKHANGWWWSETDNSDKYPQVPVNAEDKPKFREFLASLPLILERDDLRVVHACWNNAAIQTLRQLDEESTTVAGLDRKLKQEFETRWSSGALQDALDIEEKLLNKNIENKHWNPHYFGTKARYEREKQMSNPVAIVTSGEETETDKPFFAGGKWRMVERVRWWDHYNDDVPVIVGHYWRNLNKVRPEVSSRQELDLFAGVLPHQWLGARQNVYCVDFCIGGLAEQREAGKPLEHCSLAAIRVDEWKVVHDDGAERGITQP